MLEDQLTQIPLPYLEGSGSSSDGSALRRARSGTFVDNMKLPIHRWFRFSAGFSAEWIRSLDCAKDGLIFDPFAGSGTTLVAGLENGLDVAGVEAHPFLARIARCKLRWSVDPDEVTCRSRTLVERARSLDPQFEDSADLLVRCFMPEALEKLERLRIAWTQEDHDDVAEVLWLSITSCLRECSGAGTAQWQYVLPNKSKSRVKEPYAAFLQKTQIFADDLRYVQSRYRPPSRAQFTVGDAREIGDLTELHNSVSTVITSPPYPNNYDYADATRLEMTFWREIDRWADLHGKVRKDLVCSCSQHSAAEKLDLECLLENPFVSPIKAELSEVCSKLADERMRHGGKKTYHTMIAAYFIDLAKTFRGLRPLAKENAQLCFVIGDSAPYSVYVPVDRWLGQIALSQGFFNPEFEKLRDRNVKWKNRKHRVPLKEGRLWLKG